MSEELLKAIKQLEDYLRWVEKQREAKYKPMTLIKDEDALRVVIKHLKEVK